LNYGFLEAVFKEQFRPAINQTIQLFSCSFLGFGNGFDFMKIRCIGEELLQGVSG
jgi:hypothetical protein